MSLDRWDVSGEEKTRRLKTDEGVEVSAFSEAMSRRLRRGGEWDWPRIACAWVAEHR